MAADDKDYALGARLKQFGKKEMARSITLVLTQDCNLACGYCYMTGKNRNSRMSFDTAKRIVDWVLDQEFPEESVVWDFIGGEPLLEVGLMDQICDYIQTELFLRNHKWFNSYAFNMATNGVLYHEPHVQKFIMKHRDHISIGISIDGTQEKHDMHRKFPNGRGSYDIVVSNVKLWLEQFPHATTKVTFASADLPYLKESIVHLWDLGIKTVPANVVFEDVWHEGDDLILEDQLRQLADYALETGRWKTHNCTFLSDTLGGPLTEEQYKQNWCGSGAHMLAFDHRGAIWPCIRFMDYSLSNRPGVPIGHIDSGIDEDRLRPFLALTLETQSANECKECDVAGGCAWCPGQNYDTAQTSTIYQRATFICKMHKARVRANDYYFKRLKQMKGERIENRHTRNLFLITADHATPICHYATAGAQGSAMSETTFLAGLDFCAQHGWFPIVLQPKEGPLYRLPDGVPGWNVVSAERQPELNGDVVVYDNDAQTGTETPIIMLLVDRENLPRLSELVGKLMGHAHRIMVTLRGTHDYTAGNLTAYEEQLAQIGRLVESAMRQGHRPEVSVLTDRLWLDHTDDCSAGVKNFALGPNGKLYICPAFYFADPDSAAGTLESGVDPVKVALCSRQRAPLCLECSALHCKRCVFENQQYTGELNTPPRSQCVTSHIEMRQTAELRSRLPFTWKGGAPIEVKALDPLDEILSKKFITNPLED